MNPYYYGPTQGTPYMPSNYGYYPTQNNSYVNNQQSQQPTGQNVPVLPLTFVNSIDEVNRYIVPLNQSIYFRLNNANKIYLKSTDIKGVSTIEEFDLISANQPIPQQGIGSNYATKDDFNGLLNALKDFRTSILDDIKSLLGESKKDGVNDAK